MDHQPNRGEPSRRRNKSLVSGFFRHVRKGMSNPENLERLLRGGGQQRRAHLWTINKSKVSEIDEEVRVWSRDSAAIKKAMANPEQFERLLHGDRPDFL